MKKNDAWIVIGGILMIAVCVYIFIVYAKAVWSTDLPWFIKIRLI